MLPRAGAPARQVPDHLPCGARSTPKGSSTLPSVATSLTGRSTSRHQPPTVRLRPLPGRWSASSSPRVPGARPCTPPTKASTWASVSIIESPASRKVLVRPPPRAGGGGAVFGAGSGAGSAPRSSSPSAATIPPPPPGTTAGTIRATTPSAATPATAAPASRRRCWRTARRWTPASRSGPPAGTPPGRPAPATSISPAAARRSSSVRCGTGRRSVWSSMPGRRTSTLLPSRPRKVVAAPCAIAAAGGR